MYTERDLVNTILSGDNNAFTTLVQRYERLVWHIVMKLTDDQDTIKDISQEVFIRVFQKLKDFGFRSKLSTWIATVAYRTAVNELKKKNFRISHETLEIHEWQEQFIDRVHPENIATQKELKQIIFQAIERLPKQYKLVLTLYHMEDFNYKEISEITQMPEGTVKNYLFRARKLLKEMLKKKLKRESFLVI